MFPPPLKKQELHMIYITESGYEVEDTLDGLEVKENGNVICELSHKTFDDYRKEPFNELSDIEDDILESDIEEAYEIEQFLDYQIDF